MCERCERMHKFGFAIVNLTKASAATTEAAGQAVCGPEYTPEMAKAVSDGLIILALTTPEQNTHPPLDFIHALSAEERAAAFDFLETVHEISGAGCGAIQHVQRMTGELEREGVTEAEDDDVILAHLRAQLGGAIVGDELDAAGLLAKLDEQGGRVVQTHRGDTPEDEKAVLDKLTRQTREMADKSGKPITVEVMRIDTRTGQVVPVLKNRHIPNSGLGTPPDKNVH
jgi:hypothetical protein